MSKNNWLVIGLSVIALLSAGFSIYQYAEMPNRIKAYVQAHKEELRGNPGIQGIQGTPGVAGIAGKAGSAGKTGAGGATGKTGASGQDGCTYIDYYGWYCP